MEEFNKEAMELAIEQSKLNKDNDYKKGGPFGAVIIKDGKIIASAHNTVLESKDATAHAEINAIRKASQLLNTSDLSGCILYTSAEPCPMCLSAIIWANIKKIYYANTRKETEKIGFRDNLIYEYIKGKNQEILEKKQVESKEAKEVFNEFQNIKQRKTY